MAGDVPGTTGETAFRAAGWGISSSRVPSRSRSPGCTATSPRTSRPLTKVPVVVSRSWTSSAPPRRNTRTCWDATPGFGTTSPAPAPEPITRDCLSVSFATNSRCSIMDYLRRQICVLVMAITVPSGLTQASTNFASILNNPLMTGSPHSELRPLRSQTIP